MFYCSYALPLFDQTILESNPATEIDNCQILFLLIVHDVLRLEIPKWLSVYLCLHFSTCAWSSRRALPWLLRQFNRKCRLPILQGSNACRLWCQTTLSPRSIRLQCTRIPPTRRLHKFWGCLGGPESPRTYHLLEEWYLAQNHGFGFGELECMDLFNGPAMASR
jgi:hypothetical protein